MRANLVDCYAPDAAPDWHGGHLLRIWHHLRDQEVWWPWFDRSQAASLAVDPSIGAEALATRALPCLQQPQSYRAAWQAIWRYDLLTAIASVRPPVEVGASKEDAFGHLADAAALATGAQVLLLPETAIGMADFIMGNHPAL